MRAKCESAMVPVRLVCGEAEMEFEVQVFFNIIPAEPARYTGNNPHPAVDGDIDIVGVTFTIGMHAMVAPDAVFDWMSRDKAFRREVMERIDP